jgi:hypothetical protein
LNDADHSAANVRPRHSVHVTAVLTSEKLERERKPWFRANRPVILKDGNLNIRP